MKYFGSLPSSVTLFFTIFYIIFLNFLYIYKFYTRKSALKYFVRFKVPLIIYNDIKHGRISLQKEQNIQEEFGSELNEIFKENPNYKSKDQISIIKHIQLL